MARMLKGFGAEANGVTDSVRVFSGGPVEREVALVIHSIDYRRPDTLDIDGRVGLSAAADVLRDMAIGKGPNKSLIAFGYVGWEASQLEDEIGARHLGDGAGGSGAGVRRRPIEGLGRRAGAAEELALNRAGWRLLIRLPCVDTPRHRPTLNVFLGELPGGS